jgi:hypothetical protein
MSVQAEKSSKDGGEGKSSAAFVKVSLDGAPYLRKVDLRLYKSYQELSKALDNMFNSFTIGKSRLALYWDRYYILIKFTKISTTKKSVFNFLENFIAVLDKTGWRVSLGPLSIA